MSKRNVLAAQFEESRPHLQAVAYRMLGSASDADDAVREAWVRLRHSETSDVDNLVRWFITVVARVCVEKLRSRLSRREESIGVRPSDSVGDYDRRIDLEAEALLADSIGPALLVVLETLTPPERLAFLLHDMFAIRFDAIAAIVGCSPAAAQQYANDARRRVQGAGGSADERS